jgi:hypothetical protein
MASAPHDTETFIQKLEKKTTKTLTETKRVFGSPSTYDSNPNSQYGKRKRIGEHVYRVSIELEGLHDELKTCQDTLASNATNLPLYTNASEQSNTELNTMISNLRGTNEQLSGQIERLRGIIMKLEGATTQLWDIGSANDYMFIDLEKWFNEKFPIDTMDGVETKPDQLMIDERKEYLDGEKAYVKENKLQVVSVKPAVGAA